MEKEEKTSGRLHNEANLDFNFRWLHSFKAKAVAFYLIFLLIEPPYRSLLQFGFFNPDF